MIDRYQRSRRASSQVMDGAIKAARSSGDLRSQRCDRPFCFIFERQCFLPLAMCAPRSRLFRIMVLLRVSKSSYLPLVVLWRSLTPNLG